MSDRINSAFESKRMEKGKESIPSDDRVEGQTEEFKEPDHRERRQSELITKYFQQNSSPITDLCKELRRTGIPSGTIAEVLGLPEAMLPDLEKE